MKLRRFKKLAKKKINTRLKNKIRSKNKKILKLINKLKNRKPKQIFKLK